MRDKRETETHPGVGVVKEEKVPNSRKPSHRQVCGEFWNLRGQHNQEEKKKKTKTEYTPNCNCQQKSSPDSHIHTSGWELDREARDALSVL